MLQREDRRQYRLSGRKRDHVEELRRLDRYEQRAFAQLRRALRALGELMPPAGAATGSALHA